MSVTGTPELGEIMSERTADGIDYWYGPQWRELLSDAVAQELDTLGLVNLGPLDGGVTSSVLKVGRVGGGRDVFGVLKVSPDVPRAVREAAALARLAVGRTAPKIFEAEVRELDGRDVPYFSLMLEHVSGPGTLRDIDCYPQNFYQDIGKALEEVEKCGRQPLDCDVPLVEDFLTAALTRSDRMVGAHGLDRVPYQRELDATLLLLDDLVRTLGESNWVHGEVHPANILVREGGVTLIDPRPMTGDPLYDVASICLKAGSEMHGRRHNLTDGFQMMQNLRGFLDFDADRVYAWMRVILTSGV